MLGNQIPRIRIEPDRAGTDGKGAAMLMEEYGVMLDEWQRLVLDCWLGTDADGNYNVTSAGLSVSRQNGKSEVLLARCFYGLAINGEKILFTAHQMRSVKAMFRRLVGMFTDKRHAEITGTIKQIRYGIGEESIELKNGGQIQFMSRSRQAARGFDGISLVVLDEAAEVNDEQLEAILAVLSASATGIRQIIYAGTPPYMGCNGDVFRRFRQACIMSAGDGEELKSSWHEWSVAADSLQEIDLADKKLWAECNPAYNIRLTPEFTEEEFRTLDPMGFARERLGFWTKPASEQVRLAIDAKLWDACKSDLLKPEGKTAYGVKFTPDGSTVVLAGACIDQGGKARISIIETKSLGSGMSWLADWLNARYQKASCVVIDGKNGADVLIDKISGTWVFKNSVIKPTAQNVVTAASMLLNEVNEQTLTWFEGQEILRDSAITATKRQIGGGWGFGGAGSELIEACSLALWGVRTSKRNPTRQMRIG